MRTSLRRRRAAEARWLPALLLAVSLVLNGCPVTPVASTGGKIRPPVEDPGPPEVLNPSLLDRG